MRSYEAARRSFGFIEFVARAVMLVGVLAAIGGGMTASGLAPRNVPPALFGALGAMPGGLIALMGFYGIATAQMGRSSVDSAEYAQQSLDVSRKQLEVSQQALQQSKQQATSYAELMQQRPTSKPVVDSTDDNSPSYQNRPDAAPVQNTADIPDKTTDKPALEHTPNVPLDLKEAAPTAKIASNTVTRRAGKYHVGQMSFKTAEEAERYASQLGVNKNAKLS